MTYVAAGLLLIGSLLSAMAALGILRFPDVYTRLHAASKAGPLGAGLILLAVAFAAAMDLLTMTIPNRIALAMLGAFLPAALVAGLGPMEIAAHIGAALYHHVVLKDDVLRRMLPRRAAQTNAPQATV